MTNASSKTDRCAAFRVALPCDLAEVRGATQSVRGFLTEQGLHEEEITSCELALTEACNNAIQYASERGRQAPIAIEAMSNGSLVELRINDHTSGFTWPERAKLPEDSAERGRGVYLIQTVMDSADYCRGRRGNCLIMRKTRFHHGHRSQPAVPASQRESERRLAESERTIREMARELGFCHESLSAIFRCSAELGRTNDLTGFVQRLLTDLLHITSADWFLLRVVKKGESSLAVCAASEARLRLGPLALVPYSQTLSSVELKAALSKQPAWFGPDHPLEAADPLGKARPDSLGLAYPLTQADSLIGTLVVGRNMAQPAFTPSQAQVVRTFADFLATELVNARLQEEQVSHRLFSHELGIAREIQRALLPKALPQLSGFGLAGYYESARQVGGDFYDVIQVSENSLLLVMADVMGTGVPAAMFAAILRSLVRAMPEWMPYPALLLSRVNRQMFQELSQVDMFITASLVHVDLKARTLIAASAGHCPLLITHADALGAMEITPEGMPLGILPTTYFDEVKLKLEPHSSLLLYTDGLTESRNAGGTIFGQARLEQWLINACASSLTAGQLKEELLDELREFHSGVPLHDDQAFLILSEETSQRAEAKPEQKKEMHPQASATRSNGKPNRQSTEPAILTLTEMSLNAGSQCAAATAAPCAA